MGCTCSRSRWRATTCWWRWSRSAARGCGARTRLAGHYQFKRPLGWFQSTLPGLWVPPPAGFGGTRFGELAVAGRLLFSYGVLEGKSRFSKRVCSVYGIQPLCLSPIIRAKAFVALCRGDVLCGCFHGRSVEEAAALGIGGRGRVGGCPSTGSGRTESRSAPVVGVEEWGSDGDWGSLVGYGGLSYLPEPEPGGVHRPGSASTKLLTTVPASMVPAATSAHCRYRSDAKTWTAPTFAA